MRAVELVFAIGWGTFWLYWLVAAFFIKRLRVSWSREFRIRAGIVVLVIILVRLGAFRDYGVNTDPSARWPRARHVRYGVGIRGMGPAAHRAQLRHPDGTEG